MKSITIENAFDIQEIAFFYGAQIGKTMIDRKFFNEIRREEIQLKWDTRKLKRKLSQELKQNNDCKLKKSKVKI